MEAATDDIMYEREKAKGGLDFKAHHGMITQFPLTWREGFLRDKSAVFASQDMLEWLSKLETIKELREDKKKIELYFNTDGKLVPKLTPDAQDIVKDSRVTRGYGIHMNRAGTTGTAVGIKDQCEIYLKQWLYEERKVDDKTMLNLHTIKSIPLLKELLAYDREVNTDRVIALMLCILQSKELHRLYLSESEPKTMLDAEPFWSRNLFKKNTNNYIRR
jgi:hypothetical protein